jgi:hypothetical protein
MDELEIKYNPSIIIIDHIGNLIFKGGIEKAEDVIEPVLKIELPFPIRFRIPATGWCALPS